MQHVKDMLTVSLCALCIAGQISHKPVLLLKNVDTALCKGSLTLEIYLNSLIYSLNV